MEPNRVNKSNMIEPVVRHNSEGLIVAGVPFTHHKTRMTSTALTWTETGSAGSVLFLYYTLNLSIKCYFIHF